MHAVALIGARAQVASIHKIPAEGTDLTQPADQARAHDGLAHACLARGQHEQARQHWQQALNILISLGTDHTEDIEANVPNILARRAETMPSD